MSNVIEKKQITPRLRAVVSYDEYADNPRECCDPCTYLTFSSDKISADEACTWKSRESVTYKLTAPKDEDGYDWNTRDEKFEAWEAKLREEFPDIVGLSVVSLYDHSGYALSLGDRRGWDSGRIGFMFSTVSRMREMHTKDWEPNEEGLAKLDEAMKAELEEYDSYINGRCYRGDLEFWNPAPDGGWEQVEDSSMTGYDTDELMEMLLEEGKSYKPADLDKLTEAAQAEADALAAENELIRKIGKRHCKIREQRFGIANELSYIVERVTILHQQKGIPLLLQDLLDSGDDEFFADVDGIVKNLYTGLYGAKCLKEPFWPKFAKYPRPEAKKEKTK